MNRLIMHKLRAKIQESQGFTIIELLIATAVFSIVLIVITVGVTSFTRAYLKGAHTTATQAATRNLTDSISQAIQLGVKPAWAQDATDYRFLCLSAGPNTLGGFIYEYRLGKLYTGETTRDTPGMYVEPSDWCSLTAYFSLGVGFTEGKQLLGNNMRITKLSVAPSDDIAKLYNISVQVTYGPDDVFCDAANCQPNDTLSAEQFASGTIDLACKPGLGSEYCAISTLTTSVAQRVPND